MKNVEKKLHIYSVFVLVLVLSIFFVLHKDSDGDFDVNTNLNYSIPDARQTEISEDRFAAERLEDMKNSEEKRLEALRHNSFELFTSNNDSLSCSLSVIDSSGGKSVLPKVNTKSLKKGKAEDKCYKEKGRAGKDVEKRHIMKQKREQLEKEFSINLSDYGYDKYADEPEKKNEKVVEGVDDAASNSRNGFFGMETYNAPYDGDIRAVIHGEQNNLTNGSVVKLRLVDKVEIAGMKIPENTFVYGKLHFNNGRAIIEIHNINYMERLVSVRGSVYDTDGFEGLYVPDNIVSEVQNKIVSDIASGVDINVSSTSRLVNSSVSSIGNAIKSAVSGSARESKVSISSNYLVIIKIKK